VAVVVKQFRIVEIHAVDLAAAMTPPVARAVQLQRAERAPVVPRVTDTVQMLWPDGIGPYKEPAQISLQNAQRNRKAYTEFNKSILTPAFLSYVTPEVYFEPPGAPLSSDMPHLEVGGTCDVEQLVGGTGNAAARVQLRRSSFIIYDDAVATINFEFVGESMPAERFIELLACLPRITQVAASEKLASVLDAGAEKISPLAPSRDDFSAEALSDSSDILRRYGCSHLLVVARSLCRLDGSPLSHDDIRSNSVLTGILRRSSAAASYRKEEIAGFSELCLGYKSDELYATLRGTTLAVVPGHWDPSNFLTLYIEDVLTLMNFFISRTSLLDFTTHQTHSHADGRFSPETPPDKLVADTLLLRRLLLTLEESLDIDIWVNHYFTRELFMQLQHQRGIPNKLAALRRRIDSLDGILSVTAQSRVAGQSLETAVRQLRIMVWTLVVTAILSMLSVLLGIIAVMSA
jgi:hypothetical protein